MTRRTFLRVLGSAAIGTTIVSSIAPSLCEIPDVSVAESGSRELTVQMMQDVIDRLVLRERGPQVFVVHPSMLSALRQCGLVYDADVSGLHA